jgi:hypothetical protein
VGRSETCAACVPGPISATMVLVRFLLTAVIALHLAGVQSVAVSPCAARAAEPHGCCMRHQSDAGGDVIGHCGCVTPSQPREGAADVATAVSAPESHGAGVPAAIRTADASFDPGRGFLVLFASPPAAPPSPPRLTGAGFRC